MSISVPHTVYNLQGLNCTIIVWGHKGRTRHELMISKSKQEKIEKKLRSIKKKLTNLCILTLNVFFKKVYNIDKVLSSYFNSCVENSYILMIFYSFLVAGICCVTAGVIPPNQFLGRGTFIKDVIIFLWFLTPLPLCHHFYLISFISKIIFWQPPLDWWRLLWTAPESIRNSRLFNDRKSHFFIWHKNMGGSSIT